MPFTACSADLILTLAYLTPDDFRELEESTSGEFGGLGIEVGLEDGFIKVISPIDDTPAAKAGIQPGDLIIKLDGSSVKGMSLGESVDKMRGKVGTPVRVTIVRDGEEKPLEITLKPGGYSYSECQNQKPGTRLWLYSYQPVPD